MEEKKKKANNEEIVMERGKEMLEMHVGGKQVKVNKSEVATAVFSDLSRSTLLGHHCQK